MNPFQEEYLDKLEMDPSALPHSKTKPPIDLKAKEETSFQSGTGRHKAIEGRVYRMAKLALEETSSSSSSSEEEMAFESIRQRWHRRGENFAWMKTLSLLSSEEEEDTLPETEYFVSRVKENRGQLVISLANAPEIAEMLHNCAALTTEELNDIDELRLTPFRANEKLLDIIIMKKSRFVYKAFLGMLIETRQFDAHQLLTRVFNVRHSRISWQNYEILESTLDVDRGFLSLLLESQVISDREFHRIISQWSRRGRNEELLNIIYRKSRHKFIRFRDILEQSDQNISAKYLIDATFGSMKGQLRSETPRQTSLKALLKTVKVTHPRLLLSELERPGLVAEDIFIPKSTTVNKRSAIGLKSKFKNLPDKLKTEVSTKFLCQSAKCTSSDSLWDTCLQKGIQGFQKVNQPTQVIVKENAKYRTIMEQTQSQIAESKEIIRNLESQNRILNERLVAIENELLSLKQMGIYDEQRPTKEREHRPLGPRIGGDELQELGMGGMMPGIHDTQGKPVATDVLDPPWLSGRGSPTAPETSAAMDRPPVSIYGEESSEGMRTEPEELKSPQQISLHLTRDEQTTILEKIESFSYSNVSITTCIFEDDYVEFYFVSDGFSSGSTKEFQRNLVNEIVIFLKIDVLSDERIRVTQLSCKPTGEKTLSQPGNPLRNLGTTTMTTLGAFVSIEGRGVHVISCGHDKNVGDILYNGNDERLGETKVAAYCTESKQTFDVAVAILDNTEAKCKRSVNDKEKQLHLSSDPVNPIKGMVVQRFPPQPEISPARILNTNYNSITNRVYGCLAVRTDNREAFHQLGDSGLFITSVPSSESPNTVDPIGMLFYREWVKKTDDGRGYFLSLAIPITKNLEKLKKDDYCCGRLITFLADKMHEA